MRMPVNRLTTLGGETWSGVHHAAHIIQCINPYTSPASAFRIQLFVRLITYHVFLSQITSNEIPNNERCGLTPLAIFGPFKYIHLKLVVSICYDTGGIPTSAIALSAQHAEDNRVSITFFKRFLAGTRCVLHLLCTELLLCMEQLTLASFPFRAYRSEKHAFPWNTQSFEKNCEQNGQTSSRVKVHHAIQYSFFLACFREGILDCLIRF